MIERAPTPISFPIRWFLIAIIALALVNYTYLILRTGGALSENDTLALTAAMLSAQEAESILNAPRPYSHGMNYPAFLLEFVELTGLSVKTIQTVILPLVFAIFLPIVAFVTYREIAQSDIVGLFAAFLLFLQPDFLWVTWRGSHEKITWTLVLVLFFVFARTFRLRGQLRTMFSYIAVFYLVALGMINTNMFFSSSFIVAVVLTFLAGRVILAYLERKNTDADKPLIDLHLQRLIYIAAVCLLLVYITIFYLYPPARNSLLSFDRIFDSVSALVFNVDPVADSNGVNPYSYVSTTWISPLTYLALTSFSWLILGTAALTWLVVMWGFWRRRLNVRQNDTLLFLCLAFAAFSIQVVLSAFIDLSGSIGANLQVRLFTPVMLFGVPLAAIGIVTLIKRLHLPPQVRIAAVLVAMLAFLYFEFAAVSKASNEPMLSNKWIFTTQPEQATAIWLHRYGAGGTVWTGVDERYSTDLSVISALQTDDVSKQMVLYFASSLNTDYYIWSELERVRWIRLNLYMPNILLSSRHLIYDNGSTQIYRRPALTIYQN
ncbi:MAG: hypothetical protein SGI73_19305 [Chloroflexota bacterium]|nr:hypothetical protein [Chloroflexota bacterium]